MIRKMEKFEEEVDDSEAENVTLAGEADEEEPCACVTSYRHTKTKFRSDVIYQDKVIYTACLFVNFFILVS